MNCGDHAFWKALPHLPDLLASYSTKTEKVSVHIFPEKLLIALHFVLLSSMLAVQTEQERGFTWSNRTFSEAECCSRSYRRILLLFQKELYNLSRVSAIAAQTDEAPSLPKSQVAI